MRSRGPHRAQTRRSEGVCCFAPFEGPIPSGVGPFFCSGSIGINSLPLV